MFGVRQMEPAIVFFWMDNIGLTLRLLHFEQCRFACLALASS